MLQRITPDFYAETLSAVSCAELCRRGVDTVLMDLDNTLTLWRASDIPQAHSDWLNRARAAGLRVVLVSNGKQERVERLALKAGLEAVKNARKPSARRMRAILRQLGAAPAQTAVIGDQLFTDVLVAKRCGLLAVLLEPLNRKREWWATRCFNRSREYFVRKKVLKNARKFSDL